MIQIIGAGAIGSLWLAKLTLAGVNTHIVSRKKTDSSYLHFTDLAAEQHRIKISVGQQLLNETQEQQNSSILVCVKAHDVLSALLSQQNYISADQPIILMHNGFGCADEVIKHFPNNPIICATTANACLVNSAFNITHTGHGVTYLGPFNDKAKHLTESIIPFTKALNDVHWQTDIKSIIWAKLVINAVINPLTAIYQIKNGQLIDSKFSDTICSLVDEIYTVTIAEKLSFTKEQLLSNVYDVISATSENYSSMNRDIYYQRITEIDYINGYIMKKAEQHQLPCPTVISLYKQIKALERHSLTAEDNL